LSERDNRRGLDSLRQLSDEELARVAARGDERAARVLLERFEEPLYRYTVALVRDPDLAREATWSALFEAARAVRAGEHSEPIKPWIFRVAHTAADVAGGRPEGGVGDDEAAARAAAAGDPDRERLERLLAGIDDLSARDRSSFLLRELIGLEYVGIATVTGARAAATRQSVYRARQALQGEVELPTAHCAEIQAAMSKAETGIRERRSIALHLETCVVCEDFAGELARRPEDLRTLFPAPAEPLAAELVPPLPPASVQTAQAGRGGRGARRDRGGRRRGALVPLVLALLLVAAAVATAIALNDNGGGKKGRATAAGGAETGGSQSRAAAPGNSGKSKAARPGKPKAAKPGKPKAAAPSKPKAAKPGKSKGAAPAAPNGTSPSEPKSSAPSEPQQSEPNGAAPPGPGGGGHAKRGGGPCRDAPAASPAQTGYGNSAGVAQAQVAPCPQAQAGTGTGTLARTGLDVALVLATGALLLSLGVSLRRLGSQA
jgi:DNA-directed RNA polymerase specialized sigma24 family protein